MSVMAEVFVVFVLGGVDVALYRASRELGGRPVSLELMAVDFAMGVMTVWVVVLCACVVSEVVF